MEKRVNLRPLSSFATPKTPGTPDKTFKGQLDAYAYGDLPSGDMLLVARNAAEAGPPEAGDLPILMKQKIFTNDRTGDWIQRTGLPLPERIANRPCNQYTTAETSLEALADEVGKPYHDAGKPTCQSYSQVR